MSERRKAIGIFDSGLGGLTVWKAIADVLPHEELIYFADTANLPYGNKSPETLRRCSLESAQFLSNFEIKALIIACNTACTASLPFLRTTLPIPVLGILESGIDEVVERYQEGEIAILGTQATIDSGLFETGIHSKAPQLKLFSLACPLFVPIVEEGYHDHPMGALAIKESLRALKERALRAILLGCTHYPLLKKAIQKEVGSKIDLIDPVFSFAEKTKTYLEKNALLNPSVQPPKHRFYASHHPEKFAAMAQKFLHFPITVQHSSQLLYDP